MANCDEPNLLTMQLQAECELAAFVEAAAEVLGLSDRWLAADQWLGEMESLKWPADDHQKFFRFISVRAISQLAVLGSAKASSGGRDHYPSVPITGH